MAQTADPIQQLTDAQQRGFKLIEEAYKQKVLLVKEKKEYARKEVKETEEKNAQAINELKAESGARLEYKRVELEDYVNVELQKLDEHAKAHYDEAVQLIVDAVFDI